MTAYVIVPNTDVDQDSPVTVALMTALRDNPTAIVEGASGSPVLGLTNLSSATISGVATVDFTNFDATRYESYIFTFSNVVPVNNGVHLSMRSSTDGGSTYNAGVLDYGWTIVNNGTAIIASNDTSIRLVDGVNNTASRGLSGSVAILGAGHAQYVKTTSSFSVYAGLAPEVQVGSGERHAAADVDAVRFLFSSGNLSTGIITMYGVAS